MDICLSKIYSLKIKENCRGKYKRQQKNRNFSILNSNAPRQKNFKTRTSCRRFFENFLLCAPTGRDKLCLFYFWLKKKKVIKQLIFQVRQSVVFGRMKKFANTKKTSNGNNFVKLIIKVKQTSGRLSFCRRFVPDVSGSLFVWPRPPEFYLPNEISGYLKE